MSEKELLLHFWAPVLEQGASLCTIEVPPTSRRERILLVELVQSRDQNEYLIEEKVLGYRELFPYSTPLVLWFENWANCISLTINEIGRERTYTLVSRIWGLFVALRGTLPEAFPRELNFFDLISVWLKTARKTERLAKRGLIQEYVRGHPEAIELVADYTIPRLDGLVGKVSPAELFSYVTNAYVKPRLVRRLVRKVLTEFRSIHNSDPLTLEDLNLKDVPIELRQRVETQLLRDIKMYRLQYAEREGLLTWPN